MLACATVGFVFVLLGVAVIAAMKWMFNKNGRGK
mgnify:CR=1 FL=1